MKALKQAEKELELKKQAYWKQQDLVDELKTTELLPKLIKDYKGKFFKERNSYGGGREDWFIYYYVNEVTDFMRLETTSIQKDCEGQVTIEPSHNLPVSMCKNEISKEEFLSALGGIENHIAKMLLPTR